MADPQTEVQKRPAFWSFNAGNILTATIFAASIIYAAGGINAKATSETESSKTAVTAQAARIAAIDAKATATDARVIAVETSIIYIRESLARIESAVAKPK